MGRAILCWALIGCGGAEVLQREPDAEALPTGPGEERARVEPIAPLHPEQRTVPSELPIEPAVPPAEPPDPGAPGPFAVGVRTVEILDPSRDRTLLVDVWYPAAASATGERARYAIETRLGELASLEGSALRDAAVSEEGRFPLILFSHGYGGIRFQSFFLTEHWASHGYVVAAPDHPGNRLTDFGDLGSDDAALQSSIDRPLDVLFVKEAMIADGTLPIDPTRIAASGHSFGGWTTFEVGRRDPSIAAFVPLAPGFRSGATPEMAAELGRPLLVIGGGADTTCEFESNQRPAFDAALPPKALARIEGAGHLDFSNLCDIAIARIFVDDGCDPSLIDPSIVHALTRALSTAFLGRHLVGHDYALEPLEAPPVELWLEP